MNSNPQDAIDLYERMGERTTQPFALRLLDHLCPVEGHSIVDVGAGTGGLALATAQQGASVLATDINPLMVQRATDRLKPFASSSAAVMDLQSLALDDGSFDIGISNFGLLAYPTWQKGLSEMVRVTRPAGRIALSIWTHEDDCSPAHLLRRVFHELFPDRELWPTNFFPVFSKQSFVELLRSAGCTDVDVQVAQEIWTLFSSPHVVSECDLMFRGFPGYRSLDGHDLGLLHEKLESAFGLYADEGGTIKLPTRAFLNLARKQEVLQVKKTSSG